MEELNVQFSDSTNAVIVAYFGCPQDDSIPNQGQIEASDPRWASYYGSLAEAIQVNIPAPAPDPVAQ